MKFKEINIKIADGVAGFTVCWYHIPVAGWTGVVLEQYNYLSCKLMIKTQTCAPRYYKSPIYCITSLEMSSLPPNYP